MPSGVDALRIHTNFLIKSNTASARLSGKQTHLWRETQEMGGLMGGENA
jgi:hypothetical protein